MPTVTMKPPTRSDPGYMRRAIAATEIQAELADVQAKIKSQGDNIEPGVIGKMAGLMKRMVDIAAPYAIVEGGGDPKEALLDLSQDDFEKLFSAVRGESGAPLSPSPSESS